MQHRRLIMTTLPVWLLLATSFVLGLRHGVDWDHISTIMDITSNRCGRSDENH